MTTQTIFEGWKQEMPSDGIIVHQRTSSCLDSIAAR
jgi:hypothetical protein